MMKSHQLKLLAAVLSAAFSCTAQALLERAGPPSTAPAIGGFPAWYQDTSGLALEFCDPKNAAELDGGWCLLLPADVPATPETFPNAFSDEHFYFAADATVPLAVGSAAGITIAQEAAFASGAPAAGEQIVFGRIRVKIGSVPVSGTYRFIHPYGEEIVEGVAGERIFYTEDIGFNCLADFSCATKSRIGPFLLPAATPGGAELPAVTGPVPGKLYIADPARNGPVTGSPLPDFVDSTGALRNHNIFRVEGPAGSNLGGPGIDFVETTDFALQGRILNGTLAGQVKVDRATYSRDAAGQQVDVFATAFPTSQARLPTFPRAVAAPPQLSFFDAACGGVVDAAGIVHPPYGAPLGGTQTPMFASGELNWGQARPATLPTAVCVMDGSARDINGNIVPVFIPRALSDDVTITEAYYDPNTGALSVAATSSDSAVPPTLTVAHGTFRGDLVGGQIVEPAIVAPPANLRVLSSAQGADDLQVKIAALTGGAPAPSGLPVAVNDAYSMTEDAGPQILAVLANDNNALGGIVAIAAPPRLGSAVVNADGTVTYTPNLNANGSDAFTYTVAVGTQVSSVGNVALAIAAVNDAPVAVNDTVNALVNSPANINVLANDSDPEGAADMVAAVNVTQPLPLGATTTVAGGVVTFNAAATGTYTFTYQTQDATLATSVNTATVTVRVAAVETLNVGTARFIRRQNKLDVSGSVSPAAQQTIQLDYVSAAGAVLGAAATTTSSTTGAWGVQLVGVPLPPTGTTQIRATSSLGAVRTVPFKIN